MTTTWLLLSFLRFLVCFLFLRSCFFLYFFPNLEPWDSHVFVSSPLFRSRPSAISSGFQTTKDYGIWYIRFTSFLYSYETWYPTLNEENGLKVWVLRFPRWWDFILWSSWFWHRVVLYAFLWVVSSYKNARRQNKKLKQKLKILGIPFKAQHNNNHVLRYKNEIKSRSTPHNRLYQPPPGH
jgi:hypothetical protein